METALAGQDSYEAVERAVLRLFKDLHVSDPLQRRPFGGGDGKPSLMQRFLFSSSSSSGRPSTLAPSQQVLPCSFCFKSSFRSSRSSNPGQARQSYVAEADVTEEPDDGEAELIPDDAGKEEPSLAI